MRAAGNIFDQTPACLRACFTSNNSLDAESSRGWILCQCCDRPVPLFRVCAAGMSPDAANAGVRRRPGDIGWSRTALRVDGIAEAVADEGEDEHEQREDSAGEEDLEPVGLQV